MVETPENGTAQEGELIAGGYEPLLSTLNLAPGESMTGLVAFDTPESVGTLSLTNYDGTWARWPITATVPAVVVAAFGTPVHPEAGETPFTATMANPRWVATGDPATWIDPTSGSYLVLDVTVTLDEGAIAEASSRSLGYDSWQFVPDGGTAVSSYIGVTGADGITFSTGQPTTVSSLICFDTPPSPGTVNLVNADGSVLASWLVPPSDSLIDDETGGSGVQIAMLRRARSPLSVPTHQRAEDLRRQRAQQILDSGRGHVASQPSSSSTPSAIGLMSTY